MAASGCRSMTTKGITSRSQWTRSSVVETFVALLFGKRSTARRNKVATFLGRSRVHSVLREGSSELASRHEICSIEPHEADAIGITDNDPRWPVASVDQRATAKSALRCLITRRRGLIRLPPNAVLAILKRSFTSSADGARFSSAKDGDSSSASKLSFRGRQDCATRIGGRFGRRQQQSARTIFEAAPDIALSTPQARASCIDALLPHRHQRPATSFSTASSAPARPPRSRTRWGGATSASRWANMPSRIARRGCARSSTANRAAYPKLSAGRAAAASRFYRLGEPVFDEDGRIDPAIRFPQLAAHVWFSRNRHAATPARRPGRCWATHDGRGLALLYNGILGDKSVSGGNVLTAGLAQAAARRRRRLTGPMTIYGEASRIGPDRLQGRRRDLQADAL